MRISDWSSDVCSSDLLGIIAAQDRVRTVQEGHLAAKTVEDAGELDRDIAASNDHDAARQGFEFEYLVRRDSMLDAVNIRNCRLCPRSEEHTSELQSLMRISYAVLYLKNKKYNQQQYYRHTQI